MTHRLSAIALAAASIVVLAGCTATDTGADAGRITVVASTNVYGQIAEVVGGDDVDVVSIIDSSSQDPHSYEPSARDQLTVSRADLVIENGGGYDAFMDGLIRASDTSSPVLTAVEFSHDWPGESAHDDSADDHAEHEHAEDGHDDGHGHVEGFNEHVWYDLHAMTDLALGIASELGALDPDGAEWFEARASAFVQSVETLEARLAKIAETYGGDGVFVTEPVPLYLTDDAGLVNLTPDAFSEAVEEGQDVPPATLLAALGIIDSGDAKVVIVNSQTGGVETDAVIAEARDAGIPVLEFSEVLPQGLTYVEWMEQNIIALEKGLHG